VRCAPPEADRLWRGEAGRWREGGPPCKLACRCAERGTGMEPAPRSRRQGLAPGEVRRRVSPWCSHRRCHRGDGLSGPAPLGAGRARGRALRPGARIDCGRTPARGCGFCGDALAGFAHCAAGALPMSTAPSTRRPRSTGPSSSKRDSLFTTASHAMTATRLSVLIQQVSYATAAPGTRRRAGLLAVYLL
jgi:hypothetical protein